VRNFDWLPFTLLWSPSPVLQCLYKKVGRFDEAHRICIEMQRSGLLTQALSYNSVIQMYVSGGRMEEAFKIFKKMLASKTPTNDATFKALKVILVKDGAKKTQIKKLELLRRNNTHDCLYQWYLALSSAVGSNVSSFQHSIIDQSSIRIHPFDIGNVNSRKKNCLPLYLFFGGKTSATSIRATFLYGCDGLQIVDFHLRGPNDKLDLYFKWSTIGGSSWTTQESRYGFEF
jgi:pentatricopeptide repeat protein